MDINSDKYQILDKFNVSRETFYLLEHYKELVLEKNKKINLISRKNTNNFVKRHIIDCVQAIDFIDLKGKICTDIGSGAGLPGMVLAIVLKIRNIILRMHLYEKSHHKSKFLRHVAKKLKLDVNVFEKDIFDGENLISGCIIARAFKPLPIILELVEKNYQDY